MFSPQRLKPGRWLRLILLTLSIWLISLLIPIMSPAITVDEVNQPNTIAGDWVADEAQQLSFNSEQRLNQLINSARRLDQTAIAVVTVDELSPEQTAAEFAAELSETWKLGQTEQNGVLLLLVEQPRQAEITIGRGIIEQFTPTQAEQIIETRILPPLSQGNFDQAAIAGTREIIQGTRTHWTPLWLARFWSPLYLWVFLFTLLPLLIVLDGYRTLRWLAQVREANQVISSPRFSLTYRWSQRLHTLEPLTVQPFQLPPKGYKRYPSKQKAYGTKQARTVPPLNESDYVGLFTFTALLFGSMFQVGLWTGGISIIFILIGTGLAVPLFYATLKWQVFYSNSHRISIVIAMLTGTGVSGAAIFQGFITGSGAVHYNWIVIRSLTGLSISTHLLLVPSLVGLLMKPMMPLVLRGNRPSDDADPIQCAVCQQPLIYMKPDDQRLLSKAQLIALRLGSMEFDAWHCPRCYTNSPSTVMLLGFERNPQNSQFTQCNHCQERTMTAEFDDTKCDRTSKTGHKVFHCHCCGKYCEEEDTITS